MRRPVVDHPVKISSITTLTRADIAIPSAFVLPHGEFTGADRCRFFDNARGSALECAAALDVLVAKGRTPSRDVVPGKEQLWSVVSMLVASINANSSYRLNDGNLTSGSD